MYIVSGKKKEEEVLVKPSNNLQNVFLRMEDSALADTAWLVVTSSSTSKAHRLYSSPGTYLGCGFSPPLRSL